MSSLSPADRPFSPSPPRENRHTASRPPSLLFGAAPVCLVAPSTHFSLQGLPPTPSAAAAVPLREDTKDAQRENIDGLPKSQSNVNDSNYFQWGRGLTTQQPSSGRQADGTVSGEFVRARPILMRNRSDSESTTSSASPPLGANSLLAAFASSTDDSRSNSPTVPTPRTPTSAHSARFSNPNSSRISPNDTTLCKASSLSLGKPLSTPTQHDQEPPSPRSMKSVSTISSQGLSNSKSLPRLHQPTVLRSVSGKGIVFIPPPPAHASPTGTSFIHEPRSHRVSLGRISAHGQIKAVTAGSTAQSIAEAENSRSLRLSQTFRDEDDSTSPATASTHLEHGDDVHGSSNGGHTIALGATGGVEVKPTLEEDTVHTRPADSHHPLPLTPPPEREAQDNGLRSETKPQSLRATDEEIDSSHEGVETNDLHRKPIREVKQEGKQSIIPVTELAAQSAQKNTAQLTNVEAECDFPKLDEQKHHSQSLNKDQRLDKVSSIKQTDAQTYTTRSESNYEYIPPYAPRSKRSRPITMYHAQAPALTSQDGAPTRPDTSENMSFTLHATVSRASTALPLTHSRIEMDFFWGAVQHLKWIPGMSLIPGIHLHVIPGGSDGRPRGLVRTVVHTVVSNLPVVWRFANWV